MANAGGAAHDEHGESMLIEAKAAPQGLFFSGRGRAKTEVDRQPEELDAVGGHAAAQRNLASTFGRRDHEVSLAERPAAVEIDKVGDHGHQRLRTAALADRLVGDVVEKRVDRQDDIGVVLFQELRQHPAHRRPEDGADGGEGRPRVARVVNGTPRRAGTPDHRRI